METSNTNSDVVDVAKILEGSGESSIEIDQEYEYYLDECGLIESSGGYPIYRMELRKRPKH